MGHGMVLLKLRDASLRIEARWVYLVVLLCSFAGFHEQVLITNI